GGGYIASGWSLHIETKTTPPVNTALPVISGTPVASQALSCSTGSWTGEAPLTFHWQWLRDGSPIIPAAGNAYVVQSADQGHTLSCLVEAFNHAGGAAATSAGVVIAAAISPGAGLSPSGSPSGTGEAPTVSAVEITALLAGRLTPSGKAAK